MSVKICKNDFKRLHLQCQTSFRICFGVCRYTRLSNLIFHVSTMRKFLFSMLISMAFTACSDAIESDTVILSPPYSENDANLPFLR